MQDYAEDMGLTKPKHPGSPWWVVAFVFMMLALLALSGCAHNAEAEGEHDNRAKLKHAINFLCALTPRGRALAIIDLNQELDEMNISFGLGCESDQFRINIQEGELSGLPAHRLDFQVFYVHTEGEGSI